MLSYWYALNDIFISVYALFIFMKPLYVLIIKNQLKQNSVVHKPNNKNKNNNHNFKLSTYKFIHIRNLHDLELYQAIKRVIVYNSMAIISTLITVAMEQSDPWVHEKGGHSHEGASKKANVMKNMASRM